MKGLCVLFAVIFCACSSVSDPDLPDGSDDGNTIKYIESVSLNNGDLKSVTIDHSKKTITVSVGYILSPVSAELHFGFMEGVEWLRPSLANVRYDLTKQDNNIRLKYNGENVTYKLSVEFGDIPKSSSTGYRKDIISDLVLIAQGAVDRHDYTVDQITPYVVRTTAKGKTGWFFDGFLYQDTYDGLGHGFTDYTGPGQELGGQKKHWKWLIDRQFATGKGILALNEAIGIQKKKLGEPSFGKHKLVIGILNPRPGQKNWGDGLDFSKTEDRIKACCWYVDALIERFEKENLENLELAGFYWVTESLSNEFVNKFGVMVQDSELTTAVGDYIRTYRKRFYWIPYFNASGMENDGYLRWPTSGFDIAYLQPGYFFPDNISSVRLDNACEVAYQHNMGLEFEFDSGAFADSPRKRRQRMLEYFRFFEKNSVFRDAAVAYYEGGGALFEMCKSTHKDDISLLDSLATKIQERRVILK